VIGKRLLDLAFNYVSVTCPQIGSSVAAQVQLIADLPRSSSRNIAGARQVRDEITYKL
jgi:hypothetical protein